MYEITGRHEQTVNVDGNEITMNDGLRDLVDLFINRGDPVVATPTGPSSLSSIDGEAWVTYETLLAAFEFYGLEPVTAGTIPGGWDSSLPDGVVS